MRLTIVSMLFIFSIFCLNGEDKKQIYVYSFEIDETITEATWYLVKSALAKAKSKHVDAVLIKINTYGGMLEPADSIHDALLNFPLPTYAFILNNAASAGALIALSCNKIYMKPGSTMGAATVITPSGEVVPEKMQSYMRSKMRSTAQVRNKNPEIAEAMVGAIKTIKGVIDSGKVLTLTAQEALNLKYCDGIVNNEYEIFEREGWQYIKFETHKSETLEQIVRFLRNPVVSSILIMAILMGLYMEFQNPGTLIPASIAALAALIYFLPLYIEKLLSIWEVLLFLSGIALILLEIFVIPGTTITGILGGILIFISLVFSMIGNIKYMPEKEVWELFLSNSLIVLIAFIGAVALAIIIFTKSIKKKKLSSLILYEELKKEKGYIGIPPEILELKGKEGICITDMRPAGKIKIMDKVYDAITTGEFLLKGDKVKVIEVSTSQIVVTKIE